MIKHLSKIASFFSHHKFSGFFISIVSIILIIPLTTTDSFESFELKLYDLRFKLKPSIAEWDRLYFIDIDENSTSSLGQFPWTRDIYAKGLNVLKELNTNVTAFDIMFPDPSPVQVNPEVYNTFMADLYSSGSFDINEFNKIVTNNDLMMVESVKNYQKAILSFTFSPDVLSPDTLKNRETDNFIRTQEIFTKKCSIPVPADRIDEFKKISNNGIVALVYPIPELIPDAENFGFVNRFTDMDGTIRRVQLIEVFENRIYFNLAMIMLIQNLNIPISSIEVYPGKHIILKNAFNPVSNKIKDIKIPIDMEGMMHVNWAGPGPREKSFHLIPFYALIDYPIFADQVYEFFDNAGWAEGIAKRVELSTQIAEYNDKFNKEKSAAEKSKLQAELKKLKFEMTKIKLGYQKILNDQLQEMKTSLENNPEDLTLSDKIKSQEEQIKTADLVIRTEDLEDKITIIGLTATGSHDISSIPIYNEYPGVGTYLNTINTIIQEKFITRVPIVLSWLIIILICFLTGFVLHRQSARKSLFTGVTFFILLNAVALLLFMYLNVWINQLGINLAFLLPGILIIGSKLLNEESQRKYIKGAFSQFLSAEYINEIIQNPDLLKLGGENRQITTFFSDVAGFSTLSEGLTPTELVRRLNEYLSEMTDIIMSHGGYVDKYEGDAIMAFYGAPIPHPDHELRACLAAIDMKKKLRDLQDKWINDKEQPLYVRMGMNTGDAVIGNMGSENKKNYTAMGDSVNLASRLEGANKFYSTKAMISGYTYKAVADKIEARKLDVIRVIGKTEPTEIYELLGVKGTLPQKMYDCLEQYEKGLEMFNERQWKKAHKFFNSALKIIPDDGPSIKYIERCEEYMKRPPSKKWDGVYSLKSK